MSYQQLHVGKVKLNGLAGIRHHLLDRERVKTNPDINLARSQLNRAIENLSPENLISNTRQRIKQLQLKRKPRTDAVGLMDVIGGASVDFMLQLDEENANSISKTLYISSKSTTGKKMSCIASAISTNIIRTYTLALSPSLLTDGSPLAISSTLNLSKNYKPTSIAKSLNITGLNADNITLATTSNLINSNFNEPNKIFKNSPLT